MHRKAEEENRDYTEIRDEIKERHGFKNYSKLSRGEISELIGELEENDGYDNGSIETNGHANGSDDNNNNNGKVGDLERNHEQQYVHQPQSKRAVYSGSWNIQGNSEGPENGTHCRAERDIRNSVKSSSLLFLMYKFIFH